MSSNRKIKSRNITNKKLPTSYDNQLKMATTEGHKIIFNRKIKMYSLNITFNPAI